MPASADFEEAMSIATTGIGVAVPVASAIPYFKEGLATLGKALPVIGIIVFVGLLQGDVAVSYFGAKNEAKTKEQVNVATATEKGVNGLTPIYRTGNGNGTNLTPRPVKDNEGLSYSLVKPAKGLYTMTTMEAVNATGVLFAFEDAPGHVSVNPIDASKMPEWQASRENANVAPHPYTKILQSISTKVKE